MCVRVCDRKGELWALKSGGHSSPCCSERELETRGAQGIAGLVSGPILRYFYSSWMNLERANAVVIKGKKRV